MLKTRWLSSVTPAILLAVVIFASTLSSAEWNEKVLYGFQGGTDGQLPVGSVVFDSAGNLYGATTQGGATNCSPLADCGTVFQLTPPPKQGDPWTETVLYTFKGAKYSDGDEPAGGLLIDSQGNLYGTTAYGGTGDCVLLGVKGGCGTVYELSPPQQKGGAWTKTILYSFPTAKQGYLPNGDLVFDSAGNLYGATMFGGGKGTTCDPFYQYCGAVFKLSPPRTKSGKWTETVLHSFAGGTGGANPNGGLVLDNKGTIYGTTFGGGNESGECGTAGCGTVFKLVPPSAKGEPWTMKSLDRFNGLDGATPAAGVIFDQKGNLYGTAFAGGNQGNGGVFELAKPESGFHTWKEKMLYFFDGGNDGDNPMARLIFGPDGDLYGAAYAAQTESGTVFRLSPTGRNGGWNFIVLYGFKGPPDGALPAAGLVSDGIGNLYGTTQKGGTGAACQFGCGTVFEVSP
jgi:hypothetical protein